MAFRRIVECIRLDVHHVVKRAPGGSDFDVDRLVALCPACHAQTDAPYARGRLVVIPLGGGRFTCEVTRLTSGPSARGPRPSMGVLRDPPPRRASVRGRSFALSPVFEEVRERKSRLRPKQ